MKDLLPLDVPLAGGLMVKDLTIAEIKEKKTECCEMNPFVIVVCPGCNKTVGVDNVVHSEVSEVLQDESRTDKE